MPEQWTADFIGEMHLNRIKQTELAAALGITPEYVCTILNGNRSPKGAEQKFRKALEQIVAQKQSTTK